MKLHLVALPHTQVSRDFNGCAYTAKNLKFPKMMGDLYDVIVYAPEGPDIPGAAELVECCTDAERVATYGPDDRNRLPAFPSNADDAHDKRHVDRFNQRAAKKIRERAEPGDLVLLTGGRLQMDVRALLSEPNKRGHRPEVICVEPGVGYEGVFTQRCAYESRAWRAFVAGKWGHTVNGHWYDTVIPNYFDPDEFPHVNSGGGGYLMFLGRMNWDKGPHVAAAIAEKLGMPLILAGAGVTEVAPGRVVGNGVVMTGDVEWYGPVTIEERAELLAGAACLLAPTMYVEPFGGVAVEAMMAGTPAVTTDIGAFPETVREGVSGFLFNTLAEGVSAVERAMRIDNYRIREYALDNFSLAAVAPRFSRWFERQQTSLTPEGWAHIPEQVGGATPG